MKIKRIPNKLELKIVRDFGYIIKQMREECGLSQKELAIEIGEKSGTAVSLWEAGKRQISAIKLWRIACVCGYELEIKDFKGFYEFIKFKNLERTYWYNCISILFLFLSHSVTFHWVQSLQEFPFLYLYIYSQNTLCS